MFTCLPSKWEILLIVFSPFHFITIFNRILRIPQVILSRTPLSSATSNPHGRVWWYGPHTIRCRNRYIYVLIFSLKRISSKCSLALIRISSKFDHPLDFAQAGQFYVCINTLRRISNTGSPLTKPRK